MTIVKYILTITDSVSCSIYIYVYIYINNCYESKMQSDFLGEIQKIVISESRSVLAFLTSAVNSLEITSISHPGTFLTTIRVPCVMTRTKPPGYSCKIQPPRCGNYTGTEPLGCLSFKFLVFLYAR